MLNTPAGVEASYALMLVNGLSGYRQMSGTPQLLSDRAAGRLPSPVGTPQLLTPLDAATSEVAITEARAQEHRGADFLKSGVISEGAFLALLQE